MSFLKNKKVQIFAVILSVIVLIFVVVFINYCAKRENYVTRPSKNEPEGFTFLYIGENTRFSDEIRAQLRDKLGSDAIESWNTLDLTLNYRGFLKKYFPLLYELNEKLNSPVGERVEHNTIRLTYRYTRKKNVPFEYVELVFSNLTQKPLLFFIKIKKEGLDIIDTITKKYGKASTINWTNKGGKSLYWKKNRSVLILSISNDRHGHPKYQTRIYYVPSLEELVNSEQEKTKHHQEVIKKTGKIAF